MAEKAHRSLGTKLMVGSGGSAIAVGGLTSISGLELSSDTIDVTTLDSDGGYKEFINGFKDAGEVSVEGFFSDDAGQAALYELYERGGVEDFTIDFPTETGASWDFKGLVTGISTSVSLEDPIGFSATIKVSGKPTLTVA